MIAVLTNTTLPKRERKTPPKHHCQKCYHYIMGKAEADYRLTQQRRRFAGCWVRSGVSVTAVCIIPHSCVCSLQLLALSRTSIGNNLNVEDTHHALSTLNSFMTDTKEADLGP